MFSLTPDPKGFHRLTIRGRIEEAQMRDGLDDFLAVVESAPKTDFLYTITDFQLPEFQALLVAFGYIPRLLMSLPKIGKVAVVADAAWLRKAAEIEGAVIPGLTIETFALDEAEQAEDWLTAG